MPLERVRARALTLSFRGLGGARRIERGRDLLHERGDAGADGVEVGGEGGARDLYKAR